MANMTTEQLFTLGASVAVALVAKGIALDAMPLLLKAGAAEVLEDVQAGTDPQLIAARLYALTPEAMRVSPDEVRAPRAASTKSTFDSIREEVLASQKPANTTVAADRLNQSSW